jgi:hypothetical protein
MTTNPHTDEMTARIAAQSAAKRGEFLDAGAVAFKESDRGKAHAARVAAEREDRDAAQVHFTEAEFFMLEAADQSGFDDMGDDENPEMIATYAAVVVFGLRCQRAALAIRGYPVEVAALDARIEELSR